MSVGIAIGTRAPHLFVVDDEQAILDLLRRRLESLGCRVTTFSGGSHVAQTVREQGPDLVLLDVMMPDLDGFSVCKILKADPATRDVPIIMMTAKTDTDSRIKGLDLGAHDYVGKPFETAELVARIRAALRVKQLQDELREANKRLERLAADDPLTDLPNRRTFDEQFFLAIERSRRSGEPLSVVMIDLDHFKSVNDQFGHQAGDDALRHIGRLLNGRRRVTDLVGRYGGDEFVWVLLGARGQSVAEMAEWLCRSVEQVPLGTAQGPHRLTISVGVTTFDPVEHGLVGATAVLEIADLALREAKVGGRGRVIYRALAAGEMTAGIEETEEDAGDEEAPGVTRYR